eukprot:4846978-Pleurochrysis_carterae.AAC.8
MSLVAPAASSTAHAHLRPAAPVADVRDDWQRHVDAAAVEVVERARAHVATDHHLRSHIRVLSRTHTL